MDIDKYFVECDEKEKETLDSLLSSDYPIGMFREDSKYYYIWQDIGDPYYHTMWAIDKKTGESNCLDCLDFMFNIEDTTTIVDPPYSNVKIGS